MQSPAKRGLFQEIHLHLDAPKPYEVVLRREDGPVQAAFRVRLGRSKHRVSHGRIREKYLGELEHEAKEFMVEFCRRVIADFERQR